MVADVFQSMDSNLMMKILLPNTLAQVFSPWYVFTVSICCYFVLYENTEAVDVIECLIEAVQSRSSSLIRELNDCMPTHKFTRYF